VSRRTIQVKSEKILNELKSGLSNIYGERLKGVYLYGSMARGETVFGSDIDVAIILDDFRDHWEEIQRTSVLCSDLSLKYGVTLSLFHIRERDWLERETPFLVNVRREGVPV